MTARVRSSLILTGSLLLLAVVLYHPAPVERAPLRATDALLQASKRYQRGPAKQPNDWFLRSRVDETGTLDLDQHRAAVQQAAVLRAEDNELDEVWELEGPSNIGGRLTAVIAHPDDPDIIYVGAALGGVFKSTNGGTSFFPIFEGGYAQSAGALALDPNDPDRIWYGTGEANASGDSYPGNGIYLSEDAGQTWTWKGLALTEHIGRIVVDPQDSDRIYVAAAGRLFGPSPQRGVYRSLDGGGTWDKVHYISQFTGCVDLEINANNADTVYAVMWQRYRTPADRIVGGEDSGVWRSINGGDSWHQLTNGIPANDPNLGRGALAISPDSPDRLYLQHSGADNLFFGAWRSDDGGDSWIDTGLGNWGDNVYSSFGWYFGESIVEPGNPDVCYVGGVSTIRTMNAGASWTNVFNDAHVDNHGFWISPNNPATIYSAHDGGFNASNNRGTSSDRFAYLPNTQFYAITHDPSIPHRLYGGTQDNGTMRTPGGTISDWERIFGADGFYCLVDPRDSDVIFACYQWGSLLRSNDGGNSWDFINGAFQGDRTNWMTPYTFDPFNYDRLYLGTYRVWRTNNQGNSWVGISPDLTDGDDPGSLTFGTITSVSASSALEGMILAGTDDGNVWMTTSGGDNWTRIDDDLPDVWVSRVVTHPDTTMVMYATFSGHRVSDPQPYVYRSVDGGASWQSIQSNLPLGPVNDLIIDPENPLRLYVGTDYGVFVSYNYGQRWQALGGTSLPMSAVFDLEFIPDERTLIAGTHGRSMYSYDLGPAVGVESEPTARPIRSDLVVNNYPNPFNGSTTVRISLPQPSDTQVRVIDMLGRQVAVLQSGKLHAGEHILSWNGRSNSGRRVASGSYLLVVETESERVSVRTQLIQ